MKERKNEKKNHERHILYDKTCKSAQEKQTHTIYFRENTKGKLNTGKRLLLAYQY